MSIYICFNEKNAETRNMVKQACAILAKKGCTPVAPFLYFPIFMDEKEQREDIFYLCDNLIPGCVELWVLGGQMTHRMKEEILLAHKHDLDVRFFPTLDDMRLGMKHWKGKKQEEKISFDVLLPVDVGREIVKLSILEGRLIADDTYIDRNTIDDVLIASMKYNWVKHGSIQLDSCLNVTELGDKAESISDELSLPALPVKAILISQASLQMEIDRKKENVRDD